MTKPSTSISTDGLLPAKDAPKIDPSKTSYRLRVGRSQIHRWGVYADQAIPAGRKVIEYTGERINRRETKRREDTHYLFELDKYWTIDGAVGGSGAEFINHSCEPNLATRILKGHILYFSLRRIAQGEELTVDYSYDWDVGRVKCICGSKRCRGTINAK
ncbi:MAG TPA: SET domain-containing protein-lysine N-methyltransferase [Terriglobia bacterium]|nr:SET domain-containing protein-lysine N-methyltransferase [Terriglobia bacterium]